MASEDTLPHAARSQESSTGAPLLSVIVGSVESQRTIGSCLAALDAALEGLDAEVILVDASGDGTRDIATQGFPHVVVRTRRPGALVPELWSDGIRSSTGRYVALTTGQCIVSRSWARTLLAALAGGAVGAGAGVLPGDGLGALDFAVFYLRYAGFLPLTRGGVRRVDEVPGDNVAYDGGAVRTFVSEHASGGFWEVDFHRRLRSEGRHLVAVPEASVRLGRSSPLRVMIRHRFMHGHHYGQWKVGVLGQPALRALLGIPWIPVLFLARAARAALPEPKHLGGLFRSVIPFMFLAGAWAAGEAAGALDALSDVRNRPPGRLPSAP